MLKVSLQKQKRNSEENLKGKNFGSLNTLPNSSSGKTMHGIVEGKNMLIYCFKSWLLPEVVHNTNKMLLSPNGSQPKNKFKKSKMTSKKKSLKNETVSLSAVGASDKFPHCNFTPLPAHMTQQNSLSNFSTHVLLNKLNKPSQLFNTSS